MKFERYEWLAITIMISLFIFVGFIQGWSVSLVILNMCIISAIMTMGVNISWGYAGVINFGVMGFLAMGGLAAVLVSYPPIAESWQAGGRGLGISFALLFVLVIAVMYINKTVIQKRNRYILNSLIIFFGILIIRHFYLNATHNIEDVNPAIAGFLGGLGLPIIFSWIVGGLFAAGVAFVIGKVALGLRSDYLAIVTLGISEIVVSVLKHEEWLSRGVKNVIGLKRPVPYEIDLQNADWFINLVTYLNSSKLNNIIDVTDRQQVLNNLIIDGSGIFVKLSYAILFLIVMLIIFFTYFYTTIQFDPVRQSDMIRRQGGFVPGVRPGISTTNYLSHIISRITLPGSVFLASVAVLPSIASAIWDIPLGFSGISILITVGVALETMKQIESQLSMRNYEGFVD